jgi:hypothetical protein
MRFGDDVTQASLHIDDMLPAVALNMLGKAQRARPDSMMARPVWWFRRNLQLL